MARSGPVVPAEAVSGVASFIDPSVQVTFPERITIGCRSYVAPFAVLDATRGAVSIGHETDLQDNVTVSGGHVALGDHVIVAHGASIVGPSTVGSRGGNAVFIGFNAYVDRARVEPDAFVGHLARVAPGVVIRSGMKVLAGKFVRSQAEADRPELGKVAKITDADREFMTEVLHVNTALAAGYAQLYRSEPAQVRGAGRDPGHTDFNHDADLPVFAGKAQSHPESDRVRIIGDVRADDAWDALLSRTGTGVAIRADEGEHVHLGASARLADRVTLHALEHTDLDIGKRDLIGFHVVVHGGPDNGADPHKLTRLEDDVTVKEWAVVFRSKVGKGSTIGVRAYVDGSHLAPGSVVPDRAIMIRDRIVGRVEW